LTDCTSDDNVDGLRCGAVQPVVGVARKRGAVSDQSAADGQRVVSGVDRQTVVPRRINGDAVASPFYDEVAAFFRVGPHFARQSYGVAHVGDNLRSPRR